MVIFIKRLKDFFVYFDQVRQYLVRLFDINFIICIFFVVGFFNVGKSLFVSFVIRVDIFVEFYVFIIKSLFVGYFDYKYFCY